MDPCWHDREKEKVNGPRIAWRGPRWHHKYFLAWEKLRYYPILMYVHRKGRNSQPFPPQRDDNLSKYPAPKRSSRTGRLSRSAPVVPGPGNLFVVHKHARAKICNFDLRLEMDRRPSGSWAVPKGPFVLTRPKKTTRRQS